MFLTGFIYNFYRDALCYTQPLVPPDCFDKINTALGLMIVQFILILTILSLLLLQSYGTLFVKMFFRFSFQIYNTLLIEIATF